MQLYPRPGRILSDLRALGYADGSSVPIKVLNRFDQLHYHGVKALEVAISACGIKADDRILEVGSGWGGCARYIAQSTGASVTAVELQADYDSVGRDLTKRTGLEGKVNHVNADFLELDVEPGEFQHAVSWLALFHIPCRSRYLEKLHKLISPDGMLFVEDLYLISAPDEDEVEDFSRHLFPNSLVSKGDHLRSLKQAGFDVLSATDMTDDWTEYTRERLAAFRDNQNQYASVHGIEGYTSIESFYSKMAGYFSRGMVGGIRYGAKRRS